MDAFKWNTSFFNITSGKPEPNNAAYYRSLTCMQANLLCAEVFLAIWPYHRSSLTANKLTANNVSIILLYFEVFRIPAPVCGPAAHWRLHALILICCKQDNILVLTICIQHMRLFHCFRGIQAIQVSGNFRQECSRRACARTKCRFGQPLLCHHQPQSAMTRPNPKRLCAQSDPKDWKVNKQPMLLQVSLMRDNMRPMIDLLIGSFHYSMLLPMGRCRGICGNMESKKII